MSFTRALRVDSCVFALLSGAAQRPVSRTVSA